MMIAIKYPFLSLILLVGLLSTAFACSHWLSSFNPKESTKEELIKNLRVLYPEQSESFLLKRLANAPDTHAFYRAFVPYYFAQLNEVAASSKIFKFKGLMLTDAHMENFGIIWGEKGIARFYVNDFDDVAHGPIFGDVSRLAVSADVVQKDFSFGKFIDAYQDGLKDKNWEWSKQVQKLKAKALKAGKTLDPEEVSAAGKFLVKKEPFRALTAQESESVYSKLYNFFNEAPFEITDSYVFIKEAGGSFGMKRFEIAALQDGKQVWIELKSVGKSSSFPLQGAQDYASQTERLSAVKQILLEDQFDEAYHIIKIDGEEYLLRYRWEGNKGIRIADLEDAKEIEHVILDEAYALGRSHRLSLESEGIKIKDYIEELDSFKESWKEIHKKIKSRIKNAFELSR